MDYPQIKSYLSQKEAKDGSVYDHLSRIVRKIIEEQPQNALQNFENISVAVKEDTIDPSQQAIPQLYADQVQKDAIQKWSEDTLTLYGKKPEKKLKSGDGDDEEEEEEEEPEEEEEIDTSKLANIVEYQPFWQWSGIYFDDSDLFALQNSQKALLKVNPNIETSRFFGKITGINNDYWIVETKLSEHAEPAEDKDEKSEDPGTGVNEYLYYVTTNVASGEWIALPNISTPEQIKAARNVYRLFTGDLEATVGGLAHYQWNEATLLRATIARITSSCVLAPESFYVPPEEEDEENPLLYDKNEEFAPSEKPYDENDSWVHSRGHLRLEGRLLKFTPPEAEEDDEDGNEDAEEKEPTAEEAEEVIGILTSINADQSKSFAANEEENTNVWQMRKFNKGNPYQLVAFGNKLWPGAQTIARVNTSEFCNIYVGNGLKYRTQYYTPSAPQPTQSQFDEFEEIEVPDPENEDETIQEKKSVFVVQEEVMPPPPPPVEENAEEDANEDDTQDIE